jgi:proteasome lid subunit RPN8/RPN11
MIRCSDRVKSKLTHLLWDDQIERVACLIGKIEGGEFVVCDVIPARNEDLKPAEEFYISANQMVRLSIEAQRRGLILLGVAHSHLPHHPSVPSEADIHYCRHAVNAMYHPATATLSWFDSTGELWRERMAVPARAPARIPAPAFS